MDSIMFVYNNCEFALNIYRVRQLERNWNRF